MAGIDRRTNRARSLSLDDESGKDRTENFHESFDCYGKDSSADFSYQTMKETVEIKYPYPLSDEEKRESMELNLQSLNSDFEVKVKGEEPRSKSDEWVQLGQMISELDDQAIGILIFTTVKFIIKQIKGKDRTIEELRKDLNHELAQQEKCLFDIVGLEGYLNWVQKKSPFIKVYVRSQNTNDKFTMHVESGRRHHKLISFRPFEEFEPS